MTRDPARIELRPEASQTISAESAKNLPTEAGGILLGYHESATIVVTHALTVSSALASTNRYVRDDVKANAILKEFLKDRAKDDLVGYVGEWHSHPASVGPSLIDINALRAIAKTSQGPVAMIVRATSDTAPFHGVIARRQRFGRIGSSQVQVISPEHRFQPLGPLPETSVRGDGPVFISYRQSDGTHQAARLEHLLRATGLVVWRDYRDLRAGTTTDRLEQALTQGLSAAVLVVTPDIVHSEIVRERELPRLLQLDNNPAFSLSIANAVSRPGSSSACDYDAPDRLLRLSPARILADKKQSNMLDGTGELEIARDLLMHRVEQRKPTLRATNRAFTIRIQSRPTPYAIDADDEDLHIRLSAGDQGRLPSHEGLRLFQKTLPLISDAVYAARASHVGILGGAHLSIALALGTALPETKFGRVEATDTANVAWSSGASPDDPVDNIISIEDINLSTRQAEDTRERVAVFVTLTPAADRTAFDRLLNSSDQAFSKAVIVTSTTSRIDAREAGRLSSSIAQQIKELAASNGRAEVHLAFHGPYPMAVLIGRLLNTLRTVVYEWEDHAEEGPRYHPTLILDPGRAGGPIAEVLLGPDHSKND
ncbi:SAVED domain-containing protein [Paenarthrobacter nitroguajacolicus]|uniref:SAVED domain-containing protein n=1 Tax=Paenarthrobacter nitroguajacolicus TaxID=211146 RepID=UPI00285797A1|nr:SAVED domain-containing protein [Paenarthrobacter nitroguajacolicus]MDR6639428.1 integrative and conjugative element protein (TIGR02256 family) [Paenarthrobacter nitroguajacolicus]